MASRFYLCCSVAEVLLICVSLRQCDIFSASIIQGFVPKNFADDAFRIAVIVAFFFKISCLPGFNLPKLKMELNTISTFDC